MLSPEVWSSSVVWVEVSRICSVREAVMPSMARVVSVLVFASSWAESRRAPTTDFSSSLTWTPKRADSSPKVPVAAFSIWSCSLRFSEKPLLSLSSMEDICSSRAT